MPQPRRRLNQNQRDQRELRIIEVILNILKGIGFFWGSILLAFLLGVILGVMI